MKIIYPNVEIIQQGSGISGLYRHIELCGRTCYKSQDKITEDSCEKFVKRMLKNGHLSVLEHGTVYFKHRAGSYEDYSKCPELYGNEYTKNKLIGDTLYLTTNMRVLAENNLLHLIEQSVEPESKHEKRITVRFSCQIAISREFNRHRANSISEQSTRYCSYDRDKFGGLNICLPDILWDEEIKDTLSNDDFISLCNMATSSPDSMKPVDLWLFANLATEFSYMRLRKLGWSAQDARAVLPLDTATELVHTAFVSDWKHFFELRCDKAHAHPDAYFLAENLRQIFSDAGLLKSVK